MRWHPAAGPPPSSDPSLPESPVLEQGTPLVVPDSSRVFNLGSDGEGTASAAIAYGCLGFKTFVDGTPRFRSVP